MVERVRVKSDAQVDQNYSALLASRMADHVIGYALCNALFAFNDLKLVEDIDAEGAIDPVASAQRRHLDVYQLKS